MRLSVFPSRIRRMDFHTFELVQQDFHSLNQSADMHFARFIAPFLLFASTVGLHAQGSNLAIYASVPEPFVVILNGNRMMQQPSSNIRITGIPSSTYDLRLLFNNPSIRPISTQLTLFPGRELTMAAVISGTQPGQLVFMNEFSLTEAYLPSGPPVTVECPPMQPGLAVPPPVMVEPVPSPQQVNPLPGYTGPIGCKPVIGEDDFARAKASIDKAGFAETKMTIAKQVASANCLLTRQVIDVMDLFSFESDKLEFAKFAYERTYDLGNYYKVNDAFKFSGSIDELSKYIEGR